MLLGGKTVRILSIDGGGIRGIIPALILRELRDRLHAKGHKKSFAEQFDLIAGTSAGALVALGLVVPKAQSSNGNDPQPDGAVSEAPTTFEKRPALEIDDIIDLYMNRGAEIFPRHRFNSLRTVVQAFADKYESAGLEAVLHDVFGDATIRDALTNVLITSYDTERMEPFFFKKRPRRKTWAGDLNFYMRDAARASSAAPTYFEPALIGPLPSTDKRYCLIDGGVFANNPAMCAYVEARKIYPRAKRYVLVSLSTGRSMSSFLYDDVRTWGFLDWIRPTNGTPLATIMGSGQSECVNHQLEKLPGVDFFRLEGELIPGRDEIDDASEENLRNLTLIAERMIHTNDETLNRICEEIS